MFRARPLYVPNMSLTIAGGALHRGRYRGRYRERYRGDTKSDTEREIQRETGFVVWPALT